MSDVSIPMDWQPGDAVISINNSYGSFVGIVLEIVKYDAYGACAVVYWPKGVDLVNVDAILPAFC